jgi:hypothetical protein
MGAVHNRIEGIMLRQHDGSVKVFDTTACRKRWVFKDPLE